MPDMHESVNTLEHAPFMAYFKSVLDAKKFTETIKCLEVGCGPGYFAELLKEEYQDKIKITAIDPSECAISAAKSKASGNVDFRQATITDLGAEQLYDVILFSKSLHHVASLEETLGKAYGLLKPNGTLIAEEFDRDAVDEHTARWFLDRVDLLNSAQRLTDASSANDHQRHRRARMLDASVDAFQRWQGFFSHHNSQHHEFNHGHHHDMFSFQDVRCGIEKIFQKDNTKMGPKLPFLHHLLVHFGLEDTDAGKSTLATFISQEEAAIKDGLIGATGVTVIAEKK